jgi:putative ABC transport system permease protein
MIRNHFIIAWRNLKKNKVFSLINILGFAIGVTCFTFIAAYVDNELSYDKYPTDAKNIYRLNLSVVGNGDVAVYPDVDVAVGPGIKNAFPEVRAFTRMYHVMDFVKYNEAQFKEDLAFADSNFLEMFSIPFVAGNAANALVEPNSIVISKKFAEKYFANENPIGKSLIIGPRQAQYKVTGVIEKIPDNSHFHYDAFLSMSTRKYTNLTWSNLGWYTYLLLDKNADAKKVEARFPELVTKYVVPEIQHDMGVSLAEAQKSVNTFRFWLMPLTRIHLYSQTKYELEANGDIKYVYIFSVLAVFVLLLACVNFTNLSTAASIKRSREVGIRKVLGSIKKQLIWQFLSESLLFTLFAMLIAYVLVFLLLPYFNQLANKNLDVNFFLRYRTIITILSVSLFAGFLAGIYPAFFLSSFNTINVLKGSSLGDSPQRKPLRSGLIVFQFVVSIALIVATIVISQQLSFMQNKKLGYDKNQVLFLPDARLLGNDQQAFKQQVQQDSRVATVSMSRSVPGGDIMDGTEIYPKNENSNGTEIHANISHVDYDYLRTLGIKLIRGRNFSPEYSTDSSSAIIINEAAVRQLGWNINNAVGKTIVRSGQQQLNVIGIVADFNYASLKQEVAPMMLMLGNNWGGLIIKTKASDIKNFLSDLQKKWAAFHPPGPLEYHFLDQTFATLYGAEQRTQQIFSVFTILAVIIASLGLFGLSAFVIRQRSKEIGIRKVLGATIQQVFVIVSKEFLLLVTIAFLISVPVAWWAMTKWLQSFAYRINIGMGVFIIAGATVIAVTLLTISFQAMRAAIANPVRSLRTE